MARIKVLSEITGTVWKVVVKAGDAVAEDDVLIILESMKMEIPITAPETAVVAEIRVAEGDMIKEGDIALMLER
jgi:acetyl-CoA carboxylase biotin carboxyl carrier protein